MKKRRTFGSGPAPAQIRNLVIVLGDQLNRHSSAFDGFNPREDAVWMAEVAGEAGYVPSHKARIALFLSAMRHFRSALEGEGISVHYRKLDDLQNRGSLALELGEAAGDLKPEKLIVVEPGEWRVRENLKKEAEKAGSVLEIREDRHFLASHADFDRFARGKKQLRMESFYREMRRKTGLLMKGEAPEGGRWNYDADNRGAFPKDGPGKIPAPVSFLPDTITQEVIDLVERLFADHPGSLRHFDWPVTPGQATKALHDFVSNRLFLFGPFQDALWTGQPWLYHSRLSSSMNLKLLDPRDVVRAVEEAWRDRKAVALACSEGFIRQVIGWREYVRGIYWRCMPGYLEMNALEAALPLPWFYWTAETEMNCLRDVIGQTLEYGYAHHIQRLMVTGLFALLLGVNPRELHRWYLAVYVDAVEWVELPNTLGMSQYADGGIMASKPYAASGKYIDRMSNYCAGCRYDPGKTAGDKACPFSVLYWDFLLRNRSRLAHNPRMGLQLRNAERLAPAETKSIRRLADVIRDGIDYKGKGYQR